MDIKQSNEINFLKRWAEDIQKSIGRSSFKVDLQDTYTIPKHNVFICCFKVSSNGISSKEVKRVIREEADKYKNGRLYFMAYNDIEETMILLFYSFYLSDFNKNFDDNVEELKSIL